MGLYSPVIKPLILDLKTNVSDKKNSQNKSSNPAPKRTSPRKNSQPTTKQPPNKPKPPQTLHELQRIWYNKLKDTGFKDLEAFSNTGEALTDRLQVASLHRIAQNYDVFQETYYRRITNYLTHNPHWAGPHKVRAAVAKLYATGLSYRKITPLLRAQGMKLSIWSVHKIVKLLEHKATTWNRVHPEGLDFVADL